MSGTQSISAGQQAVMGMTAYNAGVVAGTIMDDAAGVAAPGLEPGPRNWPDGLTRVPYWVYQDPDVLRDEQRNIFEGKTWNYLCLEADIPSQGDFRVSFLGQMPVIVVRGEAGRIHSFENRCAHRGSLIAFEDSGNVKDFLCVYHAWRYDLDGNLCSVAFQRGVAGKGGMPADFRMDQHGPRKLRVATVGGIVFGTLSPDTPSLEDYLGPEIVAKLPAC